MKIINLLFTGTGIFIYKDAHTHTHTKKDQEKKKKKKKKRITTPKDKVNKTKLGGNNNLTQSKQPPDQSQGFYHTANTGETTVNYLAMFSDDRKIRV